MKEYSEDQFELKSRLTSKEVIDRLQARTLRRKFLSMTWTNKDFIGHIESDSFSVISASFPLPIGVACVLKGKIDSTSQITLTTTLHNAFKILFHVWLVLVTVGLAFTWLSESGSLVGALGIVVGMAIAGLILRLYLHGMYVWARRDAMEKLKRILEIDR